MNLFERLARIAFVVCGLFLAFSAGMVFAIRKLPPFGFYQSTHDTVQTMLNGPWLRNPRIVPRVYPGDGVTRNLEGATAPGLTLVQGMFEDGAEIRLYDMDGGLVASWPMDFFAAWPDPSHIVPARNVPQGKFNYHTQGVAIDTDGSIVVNYAEKGTARYGACGDLLWTLDRMTHHSITPNPDGTYWIPAKLAPGDIPAEDLILGANVAKIMESDNFYADVALLVAPDGTILREVPVLGPALDWLGEQQDFARFADMDPGALDPLHLNDIEVVNAALAAKIDGVEPGDLLYSLRNLHALAIAGPVTGRFKWMQSGPWIRQHDPDITDDGMIEVFDNGLLRALPGRDFAGSRILRYDPATDATQTLYPVSEDETFFSWIMGTQQALPNGNLLIAETARGRVIETDSDGRIVWSLVLPSTDDTAALIESALRIPADAIPADGWACGGADRP